MTTARFIGLLSALILLLTSQSMAMARGASAATSQMVICTGSGPQIIYLDAHGQPTSVAHLCPDAALELPTEPASIEAQNALSISWPFVAVPSGKFLPLSLFDLRPPTRGPPAWI